MGNARKECASHEPKENHAAGRCLHCPLRCLEALANHWQSGRKLTSARHAPAVKSVRAFDRHAEPRSNAPTPLRRREQHGGTAMRRGRPALHGARGVERLPQPPSSSYPELAKTLPWLQRAVSGMQQGQTSSGRARRRAGSQELTKRQKGAGTGDSVDGKRHSGGAKRDHGGRPCSIERLKRANDLRGSLL